MPDLTTRTFAAVLFDNDGTLTDSRGAVGRSWLAWAVDHGVDPAVLVAYHGVPTSSIVRAVAPHLDVAAATADIDARELRDVDGVTALPGAAAALAAVGGRAALVTSASRELALLRLRAAGLTPPAVLVAADDISQGKPDPEPYLVAAHRLGVEPSRCLVVEDAPAGLESARDAGAATLAVTTTSRREQLAPLADLVVDDLSAVELVTAASGVRVRLTRRATRQGFGRD